MLANSGGHLDAALPRQGFGCGREPRIEGPIARQHRLVRDQGGPVALLMAEVVEELVEVLMAARISFCSYGLGLGSGLDDPSGLGNAISRNLDFYRCHVLTSFHSSPSFRLVHIVLVVGEGFCRCAFCALRRSFAGELRSRLANFSAMMDLSHVFTSLLSRAFLYAALSWVRAAEGLT